MSPPSPATAVAPAELDEDTWEDLLDHIEDRRVVPIVGPELLRVDTEDGPRLLYDWLAEKLAARLGLDTACLPGAYTLNDVVCWFLAARGRREEAYTRLRSVLRDTSFAPPRALTQLAQISAFDLFVSTTFDPLLEQALNAERFGGAGPGVEVLAYAPNRVADLPSEREQFTRPVVYHLLGRVSASPTYVLSDEDMLEFICGLQSEHLMPEKLFHELEHNHLLLIGGNFTNWLARLFLRMTKRRRLSDPRDVGEVLADGHSRTDHRLMSFLQQVSVRTRVYDGAVEFVDELHRRWMARPSSARPGIASAGDERSLATVLFTDIVGSTELAARLGDRAWNELLQSFLMQTRRQIAQHRGREVDSAGDGVFATFDAPARAVACGLAMAREASSLGIGIRAGVHTGEIDTGGTKVAGIAVHLGARVMAQAGAGEVWVSGTVRDLTAGAGLHFEPRGEHVLKGVPGSWALFRAVDRAV